MQEAVKYDFGCLMLDFNLGGWDRWAKKIDSNDLVKPLPTNPHCTVLYGFLSEVLPQDVAKYCPKIKSFRFKITGIDAFHNENEDVLHYTLESTACEFLHHRLKTGLPTSVQHPTYIPHMTIAYLKPGCAEKYKKKPQKNYFIQPFQYRFSPANGTDVCFT